MGEVEFEREEWEKRIAAMRAILDGGHGPAQGRLLDEQDTPLALPDRPEIKLPRDALDTAAKAAQLALPKSGTQRMRVLAEIAGWADTEALGLTDAEIQERLRLSDNSVRPRRLELVEQGWVEDSGLRRKPQEWAGEYVVWRLTAAGRAAYGRYMDGEGW